MKMTFHTHTGSADVSRAAQLDLIKTVYKLCRDGAPMLLTGGMITALLAMATSIGLGYRGSL